jgi:MoaA/NifB/PqqE/SkfB family radical SAM enzyme
MYDFKNIESIQIEITERCNAACPACQRNIFGYGSSPGIYKSDMSLEQFKILLSKEFLTQIKDITFCGNLGDAQLNPYLPDMIEYLHNIKPEIQVVVNTNGSLHSTEYWAGFAKYKNMQIVWGIDGTTSEVHSFYRRNTDYNKVIENARAFIDAGGHAVWQFILFKHNQHQLDQVKKLAKEYKFKDIDIIKSDRPNNFPVFNNKGKYIGTLEDSSSDEYSYQDVTTNLKENINAERIDVSNFDIDQELEFTRIIHKKYINQEVSWIKDIENIGWLRGYLLGYAGIKDNYHNINLNTIMRAGDVRFTENRKIECLAIKDSRIFITADGYVYPCCMMGLQHERIATENTYDVRKLLEYANLPSDINNALKYGGIEHVFNSSFMEVIKQTWIPDTKENNFIQVTINDEYNSKNGNLRICASTCSNCNIS